MGPHALNNNPRPDWFFQRKRYGGILTDIAAHQVRPVPAFHRLDGGRGGGIHIANHANPEKPELEDFGEVMLRGNGGTGLCPRRLVYAEGPRHLGRRPAYDPRHGRLHRAQEYVDIAGQPGIDHCLLVDQKGTQRIDCSRTPLPYGGQLIADVLDRTETAMTQAHCFLATELALQAEAKAVRVDLRP